MSGRNIGKSIGPFDSGKSIFDFLDAPTLNKIAKAVNQYSNLTVRAPLQLQRGAHGDTLSLAGRIDNFLFVQLTEDLVSEGSALAYILKRDEDDAVDYDVATSDQLEITVYDLIKLPSIIGDIGLAFKNKFSKNGQWEFINLGRKFFAFELTADLTAESDATAKLLEWDVDTDTYSVVGDEFIVYDDIKVATLGGKSGDQGLFYLVEPDRRIISQISTIAKWVEFTINADLAPTDLTKACTITDFHDGSDPGTPLTIDFDYEFDAHSGNAGVAVLSNDGKYHCRKINQKARWVEITVTGALVAGTSTQTATVTVAHLGSSPGATITVHFDLKFESDGGGVGIATLGSDGNYHCRNIDCPA